ncbi:MAG: hypothetical protein IJM80_01100 [Firmicutes bacterium]|nr:hypothetical protein [Bacillota bacterium]
MKIGKFIGGAVLGALIVSAIPYKFSKDEETGTVEIRSLLWGMKKIPKGAADDKEHLFFAIPASGLDQEEAEETVAEEPALE